METQNFLNQPKPLMHPDRILSSVVLVISVLMIAGSAYLYYIRINYLEAGGRITLETNQRIDEIRQNRQNP